MNIKILPLRAIARNIIFALLVIAPFAFALPMGDPRTPDEELLSKLDIPVEQGIHELSLHTYMGASKIDYPDVGGTSLSPGFGAAFTYNFFFLPKWSFLVGGGLHLFNNRGTMENLDFEGVIETNDQPDPGLNESNKGQKVYLYYQAKDYSETQWSLMFMVPIMLQYQSNETGNRAFYYSLGMKIGMPFAGAYRGDAGSLKTCGYYPGLWGEPKGGYNFADCSKGERASEGYSAGFGGTGYEDLGFGDFGKVSSYSKLKFSTAFFAAAEMGVKFRLYNKLAVYTGFWLDLALNDVAINTINNQQPLNWTPTKGYTEDDLTPKAEVDFKSRLNGQAIPMSFGFTVRFAFGMGNRYALPDSIRWIREIEYRDSLLREAESKAAYMVEDSIKIQDTVDFYKAKTDVLQGEVNELRISCETPEINTDSIANALKLQRQAELEALREKQRLSEEERLNAQKAAAAARLERFKQQLSKVSNGLDDYKVTQNTPSESAREKLDTLAEFMNDYPNLKVRIVGHTCNMGTHEANIRFGMQRAESAKNYLVGVKGIDQSRIELDSKAELEPAMPNTSEANRRKNRRITIEILEGAENIEEEAK